MLIPLPAFRPKTNTSGAQGLLLDNVSAYAAYGLRKLKTSYTGSAIRVRRSSDSTEQDIGFVGTALDTASLLTFCGAGDGFVTDKYDLTGNGRTLSQATAGQQPQIVASGALITDQNGNTTIRYDGVNDILVGATPADWTFLHDGSPQSVVMVASTVSADPNDWWDFWGTRKGDPAASLFYDDRVSAGREDHLYHLVRNNTTTMNSVIPTGVDHFPANTVIQITTQFEYNIPSFDAYMYRNNTLLQSAESAAAPSSSDPVGAFSIGGREGSKWGNFYGTEFLVFDFWLSADDQTNIWTSQQSVFSIV